MSIYFVDLPPLYHSPPIYLRLLAVSAEICTFADVELSNFNLFTDMAKGSPLMGTQRGKLGESILYRKKGEQVARAYIAHPSNPNTQRQQVQRMITATSIAAYSGMRDICNHSFEGVPTGLKSMSRFMSLNARKLRASIDTQIGGSIDSAWMSFNMKSNPNLMVNPYIMSRGSLPEIPCVDFNKSDELGQIRGITFVPMVKGLVESELAQYPVSWLRDSCISDDTYLTLCMIIRSNGDIVEGQQLYRFHWVRWYCYDTEGDFGYANKMTLTGTSIFLGGEFPPNNFLGTNGATGKNISFGVDLSDYVLPDKQDIVAFCWIQSKYKNGRPWLRSNATMYVRQNYPDIELDFPVDIFNSLETYIGVVSSVGDSAWVLNGGE